jgi:hypothetical protein
MTPKSYLEELCFFTVNHLRTFQVLTAASMNMTVFWDVVPCSLVEIDRRFRGAYCIQILIALMMEVKSKLKD